MYVIKELCQREDGIFHHKSIMAHDHFVEVLSFPSILLHSVGCGIISVSNHLPEDAFLDFLHLHANMEEKCINFVFA